MKTALLIVLQLISLQLFAQADTLVNNRLYQHILRTPESVDFFELADHIESFSDDESELIEMIYYWVCENIEYDNDLYHKPDRSWNDVTVEQTLKSRKSICSGYSRLVCELANYFDIECKTINGIGQNYLDPRPDSTDINHSWNAVRIKNEWKLIDATWGAGGVTFTSENFVKALDMRYFFSDPNFMLIDHLPEDSTWQLVNNPISFREFITKPWSEWRFRKFNNLMNEEDYRNHPIVS